MQRINAKVRRDCLGKKAGRLKIFIKPVSIAFIRISEGDIPVLLGVVKC
jgi:hypothetical protein